jgi:8-oxo-dGTP pyrophosphatase MutT (NUDIX family)
LYAEKYPDMATAVLVGTAEAVSEKVSEINCALSSRFRQMPLHALARYTCHAREYPCISEMMSYFEVAAVVPVMCATNTHLSKRDIVEQVKHYLASPEGCVARKTIRLFERVFGALLAPGRRPVHDYSQTKLVYSLSALHSDFGADSNAILVAIEPRSLWEFKEGAMDGHDFGRTATYPRELSFLGGRARTNESILDTTARELQEEACLQVVDPSAIIHKTVDVRTHSGVMEARSYVWIPVESLHVDDSAVLALIPGWRAQLTRMREALYPASGGSGEGAEEEEDLEAENKSTQPKRARIDAASSPPRPISVGSNLSISSSCEIAATSPGKSFIAPVSLEGFHIALPDALGETLQNMLRALLC